MLRVEEQMKISTGLLTIESGKESDVKKLKL